MTRKSQKQTHPEEASLEIGDGIGKATGEVAGAPIEPRPSGAKPKGGRKTRPEKPNGPLPDVAQPAPEPPKAAQRDAAKYFSVHR